MTAGGGFSGASSDQRVRHRAAAEGPTVRQRVCLCLPVHACACLFLEERPGWANTVMADRLGELTRLDGRVAECDRPIGVTVNSRIGDL